MRPSKPIILLVAIVTGALLVFCATYRLAAVKAASDIRAAGERQLQIIALDLASILEKFETLPFALGFQADVRQALEHPDDQAVIQRLNAALKTIQRQSKVVSIYMMDRNGKTLASSNWDQAISFIGRDFGFRPYFREAMRGGAGALLRHRQCLQRTRLFHRTTDLPAAIRTGQRSADWRHGGQGRLVRIRAYLAQQR